MYNNNLILTNNYLMTLFKQQLEAVLRKIHEFQEI